MANGFRARRSINLRLKLGCRLAAETATADFRYNFKLWLLNPRELPGSGPLIRFRRGRDGPNRMNAESYLKPSAVERIFGRVLASLVSIGLIRGHFYVLEVRG